MVSYLQILQHKLNYVIQFSASLYNQIHLFQTRPVFASGGDDIHARGVDAAVSENVGELCDVLLEAVKGPGEQVPQIMRKDLVRAHPRRGAQRLHLAPDIRPADRSSVPRNKDRSCCNTLFFGVLQQFFLQSLYKKYRADLSLAVHGRLPRLCRLHRNKLQFADPDPRAADRLDQQVQPFVFLLPRGVQQPKVFRLRQLPVLAAEQLCLAADRLDPAIVPAEKNKQTVDPGEHRVDAPHGVAPVQKLLLIRDRQLFGDLPPPGE